VPGEAAYTGKKKVFPPLLGSELFIKLGCLCKQTPKGAACKQGKQREQASGAGSMNF